MLLRATQSISSRIFSDQRGNTTTLVDGWWAGYEIWEDFLLSNVASTLWQLRDSSLWPYHFISSRSDLVFCLGPSKIPWFAAVIRSLGRQTNYEFSQRIWITWVLWVTWVSTKSISQRVGLLNFLFSLLGNYCVFLWELCDFVSRF